MAHCLQLLDFKRQHGRLTNSDVFEYSMSNNQIYIIEYLPQIPQDVHKLLTAARNLKKSLNLYKVWHMSGQIFLESTPNDRAVVINSHTDLQDLAKSFSTFTTPQAPVIQPQHQKQTLPPNNNQQIMQQQSLFTQPPPRFSSHQGQQPYSAFAQPPPRFSSNQGHSLNNNNSYFYNYNNNNNFVNSLAPPPPFKNFQPIPRPTASNQNTQFTRSRKFTRNPNYQPNPCFLLNPNCKNLPLLISGHLH